MGLFEIYLAGVLIFCGVGTVDCLKNPPTRVYSTGECVAGSAVTGVVWPIAVPLAIIL